MTWGSLLRVTAAGVALAVPITVGAIAGEPADAVLKRVDDHYNRLKSLRTRYVETYSGAGISRRESGTLTLKKPGRMRWAYDVPQGKVFVLDGSYAWSYTPGDAQAVRMAAGKLDDLRSPLRFLLGHTVLHKELNQIEVRQSGAGYQIDGVPKGMEGRVKLLRLTVSADGQIQSMSLIETDGATTAFEFEGQTENVATQPSDFRFTPPAGIAVIDGSAPI